MKSISLTCFLLMLSLLLVVSQVLSTDSAVTDKDGDNGRSIRNAKSRGGNKGDRAAVCRYTKGDWGECDPNNIRTRTLSLKRGDQSKCDATKTETKKCKAKKACRYVKTQWSDCESNMKERLDQLKPGSDPSCEPTRRMTKKCKGNVPKKQ